MFICSIPTQPITANLYRRISRGSLRDCDQTPYQNTPNMHLSLAASAPDILQQTITLRQSVQGVVALAHGPHESAQCVHLALACESAVLINLADGDLNGCVVLGLDDAVGSTALAGDVTAKKMEISFNSNSSKSISRHAHCSSTCKMGERTGQRDLLCRSPSWRIFACGFMR